MANPQNAPAPQYFKGVVKQVLSGDSLIIRNQPKGGPPPERQINFSGVTAPRLGRRATTSQPETQDDPYGWESREFLRKKLIGKEVLFTVETRTPSGREYGTVFLGKDMDNKENIVETMVSEGLLTVRRDGIRTEFTQDLAALEDAAKAAGKGKWAGEDHMHVRKLVWNIDNLRTFVDNSNGTPIKGVIEHVRDGSTVRVLLLPDFYNVTLMISGIRCPMIKIDAEGKPDKFNAEPFAEQARYFVESRLLQRDVDIILETYNNNNLVGSIIHPNGNIAELLLREGFAKCVDWSMTTVTGGPEKLRKAEKYAKDKKLRLWQGYEAPSSNISGKERHIVGTVVEIVNGDALNIKLNNGKIKKVFLASIRPPRLPDNDASGPRSSSNKGFRPLYDIPWLYEAREFLRKKLIGQKVTATVDYIQPKQNNFPEKICCTVRIGDVNVADTLVSKGLATVVRYRQDDDQRASCYDDLLSAEAKAIKMGLGIHNKKDVPIHRVADLAGDITKSKAFLPFLMRAGRTDALVEFVASGSRLRLFIPRETCLITFLLAGITCPRAPRTQPGLTSDLAQGEPYGENALNFTKDLILQREVEIEVESSDKGGNFIGWLHHDGKNLSVQLVEAGLSSVHVTAEGSKFYSQLMSAEESAKANSLGIWKGYVEPEKETERIEEISTERNVDHRRMVISEVTADGRLYGQYCSDETALTKLMDGLREEFDRRPPVGGSYTPRKGDLCAAKFTDGAWYRAKVEKCSKGGQVSVLYIDYGNREDTHTTKCAQLPGGFSSSPPFAHEMSLACVKLHQDEDNKLDAINALMNEVMDREVAVNKEFRFGGLDYVTIQRADNKADISKTLLSQGYVLVDTRKEKKLQGIVSEYKAAQDEAKKKHLNLWRYGDITEDDAFEFGMER